MFHDVPKKSRTRRKIEKVIASGIAVFIDLRQRLRHSRVEPRIMKFSTNVVDPLHQPGMQFGIYRAGGELLQIVAYDLLVLFPRVIIAADAQNREVSGK